MRQWLRYKNLAKPSDSDGIYVSFLCTLYVIYLEILRDVIGSPKSALMVKFSSIFFDNHYKYIIN